MLHYLIKIHNKTWLPHVIAVRIPCNISIKEQATNFCKAKGKVAANKHRPKTSRLHVVQPMALPIKVIHPEPKVHQTSLQLAQAPRLHLLNSSTHAKQYCPASILLELSSSTKKMLLRYSQTASQTLLLFPILQGDHIQHPRTRHFNTHGDCMIQKSQGDQTWKPLLLQNFYTVQEGSKDPPSCEFLALYTCINLALSTVPVTKSSR